jgi:hypothetical protein
LEICLTIDLKACDLVCCCASGVLYFRVFEISQLRSVRIAVVPKTETYQKKQNLARMKTKPQINTVPLGPSDDVPEEVLVVAL